MKNKLLKNNTVLNKKRNKDLIMKNKENKKELDNENKNNMKLNEDYKEIPDNKTSENILIESRDDLKKKKDKKKIKKNYKKKEQKEEKDEIKKVEINKEDRIELNKTDELNEKNQLDIEEMVKPKSIVKKKGQKKIKKSITFLIKEDEDKLKTNTEITIDEEREFSFIEKGIKKGGSFLDINGSYYNPKNDMVYILVEYFTKDRVIQNGTVSLDKLGKYQILSYIIKKYKNSQEEDKMIVIKYIKKLFPLIYSKICDPIGASSLLKTKSKIEKYFYLKINRNEINFLLPRNIKKAQIQNNNNLFGDCFVEFEFLKRGKLYKEVFTFHELQEGLQEKTYEEIVTFCLSLPKDKQIDKRISPIIYRMGLKMKKPLVTIRKIVHNYQKKLRRTTNICLFDALRKLVPNCFNKRFKELNLGLKNSTFPEIIKRTNLEIEKKNLNMILVHFQIKAKNIKDVLKISPPNSIIIFFMPHFDNIGHSIYINNKGEVDSKKDMWYRSMLRLKRLDLEYNILAITDK